LNNLKKKSVIVIIVMGVSLAAGIIVLAALSKSVQDQDVLIQRERIAMTIALSRSEVEGELNNIHSYGIDYEWRENNVDHITITTLGSLAAEPLYSDFEGNFDRQYVADIVRIDVNKLNNATGFKEIFRGNKVIQVDIDRNTNVIIATRTDPASDRIVTTKFTDGQKKALSIALSDDSVRNIISNSQYYLAGIRETGVGYTRGCGENECSLVGLALASSTTSGVHAAIILNTDTGKLVDVAVGN
jgi:hypothetical protein